MHEVRLTKKARRGLLKLEARSRRMTVDRLAELRRVGVEGADGRLFSDDREYYWLATPGSFIVFKDEGERLVVVYAVAARSIG